MRTINLAYYFSLASIFRIIIALLRIPGLVKYQLSAHFELPISLDLEAKYISSSMKSQDQLIFHTKVHQNIHQSTDLLNGW